MPLFAVVIWINISQRLYKGHVSRQSAECSHLLPSSLLEWSPLWVQEKWHVLSSIAMVVLCKVTGSLGFQPTWNTKKSIHLVIDFISLLIVHCNGEKSGWDNYFYFIGLLEMTIWWKLYVMSNCQFLMDNLTLYCHQVVNLMVIVMW